MRYSIPTSGTSGLTADKHGGLPFPLHCLREDTPPRPPSTHNLLSNATFTLADKVKVHISERTCVYEGLGVCVWGGGCSGLTSENYGRIQSHPVTHTHTQPLGVCGGLGDSEFGRSFQNLGRKSPLVLALQGFGAGCVCEGLDVWLFGGTGCGRYLSAFFDYQVTD